MTKVVLRPKQLEWHLTGITRCLEPFLASAAAVGVHGAAATVFGPAFIAEDLPDLLPGVFRRLDNLSLVDCLPTGARWFQPNRHCGHTHGHDACDDAKEAWGRP